jgi:hypothetical protein
VSGELDVKLLKVVMDLENFEWRVQMDYFNNI